MTTNEGRIGGMGGGMGIFGGSWGLFNGISWKVNESTECMLTVLPLSLSTLSMTWDSSYSFC